jgi:hypothetical protein
MFEDEIDYALECTPAADRARLTKIMNSLELHQRERVNEIIRRQISEFNYSRSVVPGSAGKTAYDGLMLAVKKVKSDRMG